MEDVLEFYRHPYDAKRLVVCLDETSKQLVGELRTHQSRTARERRLRIKELVAELDPEAKKIVLVMDSLNTHKIASLCEAFEPSEARRLAEKLEIHFSPKHGSWLNMAETELATLAKQCLSRRIPTKAKLKREVTAWQETRNESEATVDWQFKTEDARIKLKQLSPSIGPLVIRVWASGRL